ncbi:MAG: hypothetical protein K0S58_3392 [Nitrospira sp.]|nr:hypothetical protein [Nitrospira sp.]
MRGATGEQRLAYFVGRCDRLFVLLKSDGFLGLLQACALLNLLAHGGAKRLKVFSKQAYMVLPADFPMPRHEPVKIQPLDLFQ